MDDGLHIIFKIHQEHPSWVQKQWPATASIAWLFFLSKNCFVVQVVDAFEFRIPVQFFSYIGDGSAAFLLGSTVKEGKFQASLMPFMWLQGMG